jgi:hypothetical protein
MTGCGLVHEPAVLAREGLDRAAGRFDDLSENERQSMLAVQARQHRQSAPPFHLCRQDRIRLRRGRESIEHIGAE